MLYKIETATFTQNSDGTYSLNVPGRIIAAFGQPAYPNKQNIATILVLVELPC